MTVRIVPNHIQLVELENIIIGFITRNKGSGVGARAVVVAVGSAIGGCGGPWVATGGAVTRGVGKTRRGREIIYIYIRGISHERSNLL